MRRKYYKVVMGPADDGTFVSAWIRDYRFTLTYALGEITRPKVPGTGVVVFDTLEQARGWARRWIGSYEFRDPILEGVGDRCRLPLRRCHAPMGRLDSLDVDLVWHGRSPKLDMGKRWPGGTLALKWFKAERIVQ